MIKKTFMIITACLLCSFVQAQQSLFEQFNLPRYDCEQKIIRDMKKVIVVVPDDSTIVWTFAKNIGGDFSSKGLEVAFKTESQLNENDLDNNLCIMGPITSFSHWNKFSIPVKKLKKGFGIRKFSFDDPSYSFSYVSATSPVRIVMSGNSIEAYKQAASMPSFGYEYIVLRNAVPEFIGNGSQITDLNALKKSLFTTIKSKYYIFMVSRNLSLEDEKVKDSEIEKYNKDIEDFVNKMKLNLPEKKIKAYILSSQDEIHFFTGWFEALCKHDGNTYGFVKGDEIYSWKWGRPIVHEAIHHIFNGQINENFVTFFAESVPMWYELSTNPELKKISFQKAIECADEDLTDVICGRENFFQGDKYYFIAGIFADYLIETYGINKFKELYKYNTQDILSFEKAYSKPLSEILGEYRKWLMSKSANQDKEK